MVALDTTSDSVLKFTTGGKLGTGIKRVQAALVVLMLTILGFIGTQPAIATQTEPGPGQETGQPIDPGTPTAPVVPPVVVPPIIEPSPTLTPLEPETPTVPVQPTVEPAPVIPPAIEPATPSPAVPVVTPAPTQDVMVPVAPTDAGFSGYVDPEVQTEVGTSSPAEPTPSPTPTPVATKTAAPPVVSADIAGPLKVALAPVAENNPIVQGLTVLVLILLGAAYFRALRTKRVPGPRFNGK